MSRRAGWIVAAVIAAVGGPAAAVAIVQSHVPDPGQVAAVADSSRITRAKVAINTVTVKGRAAKTGYSRARFGDGWRDTGHDCTERDVILARDLDDERLGRNGCTVLSGTYPREPYTGHRVTFRRGGPYGQQLDIDHVYPLSLAWQQGAQQWTPALRERFANDPDNLLASDPSANRQKGDSGPAAWLPVKASRCDYVARMVIVAAKYRLSMNPPDRAAAGRILDGCR